MIRESGRDPHPQLPQESKRDGRKLCSGKRAGALHFLLSCDPAKCRNVSGNRDVVFKDECLSLQSLSSKASSPNCSAARVSTSRRIPMGASRAPQRTPAPSVRGGSQFAGWEVGRWGPEMTILSPLQALLPSVCLPEPQGKKWSWSWMGARLLGTDACSLLPKPTST